MILSHQSPRAKRLARRARRQAGAQHKLNLVSLMDIFTILVFFLLVNSSAVEVLPNPRHIELPASTADQRARETVTVMITKSDILVNGEPVMTVAEAQADDRPLLGALKSELLRVGPLQKVRDRPGVLTRGDINVMADRSIPWSLVRKVMATASDARYARISLAVMHRPEEAAAQ